MSPLRIFRINKGFHTQASFAKDLGVSKESVVRWENGIASPSKKYRVLLQDTLDISSKKLDKLLV